MSRTDLPSEKASNFQARLRETVQTLLGTRGDKLDRALTLRDMIESKLFELRPGAVVGSGAAPLQPGTAWPDNTPAPYAQDLTPPPAPEGVTAITSGNSIQVTVNPQTYRQGNGPGTVTVYGAKYLAGGALPTFSDAAILDEFPGDVHAFQVDPGSLYRIWVKSVSRDGVPSSPAGGTNGIAPSPGLLDDVSIAALAVSRLRSGSVTVGQFIQASNYVPGTNGWRINGDGTAEFSGVVVRGTVYATAGQIGGITIAANAVRAGQTAHNTGSGFHLGADGRLSLGNSAGNSLTWDGSSLNVSGTINGSTINGSTMNSGALNLQGDGGTGWGYARSLGKWWNDGVNGWVFARQGSDGGTFAEMKGGDQRIWMSSWGDCGIQFPGITMTNGGLTINQANVINTLNIAGNAVTVPAGASSNANLTWSTTSEQTLLSLVIDPAGGSVFIVADFSVGPGSMDAAGTAPSLTVSIKRNGVTLRSLSNASGRYALSWVDSGAGFGASTYAVTAVASGAATSLANSAGPRSLAVIGAKR